MPFWLPDLQPKTSYVDLRQTYIARPVDDHNEHRIKKEWCIPWSQLTWMVYLMVTVDVNGVSHGHSWREWCIPWSQLTWMVYPIVTVDVNGVSHGHSWREWCIPWSQLTWMVLSVEHCWIREPEAPTFHASYPSTIQAHWNNVWYFKQSDRHLWPTNSKRRWQIHLRSRSTRSRPQRVVDVEKPKMHRNHGAVFLFE